jgi:hypothetical protein
MRLGGAKAKKKGTGSPQVSKSKPHRSFHASAQLYTHTFRVPDVFKKLGPLLLLLLLLLLAAACSELNKWSTASYALAERQ